MSDDDCPVCKSPVSGAEAAAECPSCGANLERSEHGAWQVAGDAPAG